MRVLFCMLMLPLLLAACGFGDGAAPDGTPAASAMATQTTAADRAEPTATGAVLSATGGDAATATPAADMSTLAAQPAPTSPADEYAGLGYVPFDRPEVALMLHPRLREEPTDPPSAEAVFYSFVDPESPYFSLDIDTLKTAGSMPAVSDQLIRDEIAGLVADSGHIAGYEIFDSQETMLTDRPGRIARFHFTSDGEPAYAALMLFSHGDWLYRFIVYGDADEYPALEDIIHSIFQTAYLRGPA